MGEIGGRIDERRDMWERKEEELVRGGMCGRDRWKNK